jgi:hypothetical protein
MLPELIHTFETSVKFIEQSVADLSEQQMVEQPAGVPNHTKASPMPSLIPRYRSSFQRTDYGIYLYSQGWLQ